MPVAPPHEHPHVLPEIAWDTPESWTEKPGGGMRVASFVVGDGAGDGSVVILSGDAGGEVENVKRWAGQVDVTMNDAAVISFIAKQERVESSGGLSVLIVDLTTETNEDADSAVGAITEVQGHTVFLKLTGKAGLLKGERDNFISLCKTLRLATGPAKMGKIAWQAPEGWAEQAGAGMRLGTLVPPDGGECSIVSLSGAAGGAQANIERWLGQIDVTMSEDELLAFLGTQELLTSSDGHNVMLIDMTGLVDGEDAESMLAAISRFGEKTIFVKLMGKVAYLKAQQAGFKSLCESLHLAEDAP